MAGTVRPFYALVQDPENPGGRIRSEEPERNKYLIRYKDHLNRWRSEIFEGKRSSAEKRLQQLQVVVGEILAKEKPAPEAERRLVDAFDEYCNWLKSDGKKDSTVIRYQYSFSAFIKNGLRSSQVRDITVRDINNFRAKREAEVSRESLYIDLRHLRAFFNWCKRMRYILESPMVNERFESQDKPIRFLTEDELTRLYQVLESDPEMKDLVKFYICTAARAAELLPPRFTWSNVHEDKIRLLTKRDKVRYVGLTQEMIEILESRKGLSAPFPYKYASVYRRIVMKAYVDAGIVGANIHSLRKTAGSRLVQKGVDIYRVSAFLGHSSVRVTEKHYAELLPSNYENLAEIIESGLPDTHMIRKNSTNLYQISDFGKMGKSAFVDEDFVARAGIEPATHGFSVHCSTD